MAEHIPVLLRESIEHLNIKNGGVIVDATLGSGGHTAQLLRHVGPDGMVVGIDLDQENISRKEKELTGITNLKLVHGNFGDLAEILGSLHIDLVNGIIADLGFSSRQLESVRGLSFQKEAPLDMRLNMESSVTAADILAIYAKKDLERIFREYGEEKRAERIADLIAIRRVKKPITETKQLVSIVKECYAGREKVSGIHVATKVFMALRIAVNGELQNLEKLLNASLDCLAPGGRIAVISFHSLEDRLVKNFFRRESRKCVCPDDAIVCTCQHLPKLKTITSKPIRPSSAEVEKNPRSRSARLRVAERIHT